MPTLDELVKQRQAENGAGSAGAKTTTNGTPELTAYKGMAGDVAIYTTSDGRTALVINNKRETAYPSNSGKMLLTATTHGFCSVPGSDLRVSLSAGFRR